MKANQQLVITRTFDASKAEVFNAFATPEALAEWWGPVEAPIDVISLDFNPGGKFHYRMNGAMIYYGVFCYQQIIPHDKIVWINSFANEAGEIIKAPFPGLDFPLEVFNVLTLEEKGVQTVLTLVSEPYNATESETAAFNSIYENMQQGFGGTLNQLESYLKRQTP
jgi:uncharacterized protein YndB with AHSA1/START domain